METKSALVVSGEMPDRLGRSPFISCKVMGLGGGWYDTANGLEVRAVAWRQSEGTKRFYERGAGSRVCAQVGRSGSGPGLQDRTDADTACMELTQAARASERTGEFGLVPHRYSNR